MEQEGIWLRVTILQPFVHNQGKSQGHLTTCQGMKDGHEGMRKLEIVSFLQKRETQERRMNIDDFD